jgi:hypothetical protein
MDAEYVDQRLDLNLIGSRLAKVQEELQNILVLTRQAANTIFGSIPEEELRRDKDERPPTIINLTDNIERLVRQCQAEVNRF